MKKIGIMTYHNTRNFGGVLQAYALQKTLNKFGKPTEIIDYHCDKIQKNYKIKKFYENKSLKEFIKWILTVKDFTISQKKFNEFFSKYYVLSDRKYDINNIFESNAVYDIFITGSDQVWNMKLTGNDNSFFLNFVDKSKIKASYAASFGYKVLPDEYTMKTKNLISDFSYISTREEEGKSIIKNISNKDISVVLDPTFLLDKKDWEELSDEPLYKEDYIFVYIVAPSKSLINFARQLSKQTNCKVICTQYTHKKILNFKNRCDISPTEFLSLIKNAKYVITTSFHGVALSINMNKQFFYELDTNKNNYNSRIETIIKKLGIKGREIKEEIDFINIDDINFNNVNIRLKDLRMESLCYLKQIMEE